MAIISGNVNAWHASALAQAIDLRHHAAEAQVQYQANAREVSIDM
jgi:hypothetical protein